MSCRMGNHDGYETGLTLGSSINVMRLLSWCGETLE